jgi:hypothetical protein
LTFLAWAKIQAFFKEVKPGRPKIRKTISDYIICFPDYKISNNLIFFNLKMKKMLKIRQTKELYLLNLKMRRLVQLRQQVNVGIKILFFYLPYSQNLVLDTNAFIFRPPVVRVPSGDYQMWWLASTSVRWRSSYPYYLSSLLVYRSQL